MRKKQGDAQKNNSSGVRRTLHGWIHDARGRPDGGSHVVIVAAHQTVVGLLLVLHFQPLVPDLTTEKEEDALRPKQSIIFFAPPMMN